MRIRSLVLVLSALTLTACNDVLTANGKAGFVALTTFSDGGGGHLLDPIGVFYGRTDITLVPPTLDACQVLPYSQTGSTPPLVTLDAGPRVITVLPTHTDTLFQNNVAGFLTYHLAGANGMLHTPGDSISVIVEGGPEFPAVSLRMKTAEAFTNDPVPVPSSLQAMTVTWTPGPTSTSFMLMSLRYANASSTGLPNEQIFCAFVDDGSGLVPSIVMAGWVSPNSASRSSFFQRARVVETSLSSNTRFTVSSTYEQPLSTLN